MLETGNGVVTCDRECDVYVQSLKTKVTALLTPPGTPSVLSFGTLVQDHGIFFQWCQRSGPRIVLPCGTEKDCVQADEVPFLAAQTQTKKGILERRSPGTATGAAESGIEAPAGRLGQVEGP